MHRGMTAGYGVTGGGELMTHGGNIVRQKWLLGRNRR
jgi:hypothetical protein